MRKENGITLIALVVTIIVLLILAGITISLIIGQNGIIRKTNEAKEATREGEAREEISLAWLDTQAEKASNRLGDKTVRDYFEEALRKKDKNATVNQVGDKYYVIYKGYNAVVTDKGEITIQPEIAEGGKIVDACISNFKLYILDDAGRIKLVKLNYGDNIINKTNTEYSAMNYMGSGFLTTNKITKIDDGIALDDQGKVYTWGYNTDGQLGDGTDKESSDTLICISDIPGNILNGKKIIDISSGGYNRMVLDEQGKVYTWGTFVGDGTDANKNTPTCISDIPGNILNGKKITDINSSEHSKIALDSQGKVYTWGANWEGDLGDGTDKESSNVPICISDIQGNALNGKKMIAISYGMTLDNEGKVYTWGEYLGDGTRNVNSAPICISDIQGNLLNGKKITIIAAAKYSSRIVMDNEGKIYNWGYHLGENSTYTPICISEEEGNILYNKKVKKMTNTKFNTIVDVDDIVYVLDVAFPL